MAYPGKLITFEGIEGSGKSTQIDMARNHLEEKGLKVLKLREPGGVEIAEKIRKVLLDPETKSDMCGLTEMFLFSAARAQFIRDEVESALKKGIIVLLDRYYDSTTAYQGYGMGVDLQMITTINKIASNGIKPDMTFIIDIPAEIGIQKTLKTEFGQKDRIERKSIVFHKKVREGYLEMAKKESRFIVIDYVDGGIGKMHKEIVMHIEGLLQKGQTYLDFKTLQRF